MGRAPWILGGSIVVAAVVIAVALVGVNGTATSPERPTVPADVLFGARERAKDRAAQSMLRNAIAVAQVYYTQDATFTGLNRKTAAKIDATLVWQGDAPATEGAVSINVAKGQHVVMSTLSASGQPFCIAQDAYGGTSLGSVDAVGGDAASCVGGW